MDENLIVIEWSIEQGCFHSHTVKKMLKHNQDTCTGRCGFTDFIPIGIFKTEEESVKFMEKIGPRLRKETRNVRR